MRPNGIKIGNVRCHNFVQVPQAETVEVIETLPF
jgi:hypothetical protein